MSLVRPYKYNHIIIENCPLSETILSLEEPTFQDFIFIGVSLFLIVVAEIDKEIILKLKPDSKYVVKYLKYYDLDHF